MEPRLEERAEAGQGEIDPCADIKPELRFGRRFDRRPRDAEVVHPDASDEVSHRYRHARAGKREVGDPRHDSRATARRGLRVHLVERTFDAKADWCERGLEPDSDSRVIAHFDPVGGTANRNSRSGGHAERRLRTQRGSSKESRRQAERDVGHHTHGVPPVNDLQQLHDHKRQIARNFATHRSLCFYHIRPRRESGDRHKYPTNQGLIMQLHK